MRCHTLRDALLGATSLFLLLLPAVSSRAEIVISPDITVSLSGMTHADESAPFLDDPILQLDLGPLVEADAVSALAFDASTGHVLFALESTKRLSSALTAEPRDVVRYDGSAYSLELDGSAAGLPASARIDAVAIRGTLIVSLDTTVDLGAGLVAQDEDLVEWDGSAFVAPLFFDGSDVGVPVALDLDAVHWNELGQLLVSFDVSGEIGGIAFQDEDLLEYGPVGSTWALLVDGDAVESALGAADVDAVTFVPEPGVTALLVAGCLYLGAIRRRRAID